MLPSSPQVNEVYLSGDGILSAIRSLNGHGNTLAIDSTTLDVSTAKQVSKQVAEEGGIRMVDAPVSGGPPT